MHACLQYSAITKRLKDEKLDQNTQKNTFHIDRLLKSGTEMTNRNTKIQAGNGVEITKTNAELNVEIYVEKAVCCVRTMWDAKPFLYLLIRYGKSVSNLPVPSTNEATEDCFNKCDASKTKQGQAFADSLMYNSHPENNNCSVWRNIGTPSTHDTESRTHQCRQACSMDSITCNTNERTVFFSNTASAVTSFRLRKKNEQGSNTTFSQLPLLQILHSKIGLRTQAPLVGGLRVVQGFTSCPKCPQVEF